MGVQQPALAPPGQGGGGGPEAPQPQPVARGGPEAVQVQHLPPARARPAHLPPAGGGGRGVTERNGTSSNLFGWIGKCFQRVNLEEVSRDSWAALAVRDTEPRLEPRLDRELYEFWEDPRLDDPVEVPVRAELREL